MTLLSKTEEMLLLCVCRLQGEAFGRNIRKEVEDITGKKYSVGGIYVPLDRLVRKGLLTMEDSKPSPERLGRPRRLYKITAIGLAELKAARTLYESMWASLPDLILQQLRLT